MRAVSMMEDAGGAVSAAKRVAAKAAARTTVPFIGAIVLVTVGHCQGSGYTFFQRCDRVTFGNSCASGDGAIRRRHHLAQKLGSPHARRLLPDSPLNLPKGNRQIIKMVESFLGDHRL